MTFLNDSEIARERESKKERKESSEKPCQDCQHYKKYEENSDCILITDMNKIENGDMMYPMKDVLMPLTLHLFLLRLLISFAVCVRVCVCAYAWIKKRTHHKWCKCCGFGIFWQWRIWSRFELLKKIPNSFSINNHMLWM